MGLLWMLYSRVEVISRSQNIPANNLLLYKHKIPTNTEQKSAQEKSHLTVEFKQIQNGSYSTENHCECSVCTDLTKPK